MSAARFDRGPGPGPVSERPSRIQRAADRRAELATQSWPDYFRGLAVRTAIILAIVVAAALVTWLLSR